MFSGFVQVVASVRVSFLSWWSSVHCLAGPPRACRVAAQLHPHPPVFQDSSYLDDLSNASIFSSSVDSLSDIADTPDFLPADSLSQVPTIWDVSTGPTTHDKVSGPSWAGADLGYSDTDEAVSRRPSCFLHVCFPTA